MKSRGKDVRIRLLLDDYNMTSSAIRCPLNKGILLPVTFKVVSIGL